MSGTAIPIQAEGLICEHPGGRGVRDLDFEVRKGECFAVLGRNGSGKTTLTRLVIGLDKPSGGRLRLFGKPAPTASRAVKGTLGTALDRSAHWEKLTGWDHGWFAARCQGLSPEAAAERLAALFRQADLEDRAHDPVGTYSFGMRRKLSLIQAMVHDPELLAVDEPTLGLDPPFLMTLTEWVRDRSRRGKTTWLAGNDPEWLEQTADRALFLVDGRAILCDTVENILAGLEHGQQVKIRLARSIRVDLRHEKGVRDFRQSGREILLLADPDPLLVPSLIDAVVRRGGRIETLEVKRKNLRDAFLLHAGCPIEP